MRLLIDALTVYTGLHICAKPGVSYTIMEISHYSLSCAASIDGLNFAIDALMMSPFSSLVMRTTAIVSLHFAIGFVEVLVHVRSKSLLRHICLSSTVSEQEHQHCNHCAQLMPATSFPDCFY